MLVERAGRTTRRRERCQGPSIRKTKTSPRSAPARPCAPNRPRSCEHRRSARPGPPGSPPTRRGRRGPGPPRSRFPSQFGNRAPGDKEGGRAGSSGWPRVATPSGLGGKSSVASPPSPPPAPAALSPAPSTPPAPFWSPTSSPAPRGPRPWPAAPQPAQRPSLTGRRGPPEPPPPPGLGPSCRPPPHVPRVAIAFAATVVSPPLTLSPPPRLRLSLQPRPKPLPPPPPAPAPAAWSHGEAPAHCAPRWGRGRPTAAWEPRARGTWRSGGSRRPGAPERPRERPTFPVRSALSRMVPDAADARMSIITPQAV
ncbi:HIG1 domain family member 1B isoform X1 [Camelus ferus]|uniref:HIG1 domain family member 1B isoform X1 n=1 Tax=Camelus ferus TaxID=419612 RepID=A0A8B8R8B7_CAMFR|nr:HIG1 domain family member 1B isoform X1 [Camelus ferus]